MTYPTYNTVEVEALPTGTYLALFHGRNDPKQDMEGWGFDGPVIGPINWAHTTYGDEIKIALKDEHDASLHITVIEGCASFEGKYYGDWTVFQHVQRRVRQEPVPAERRTV